MQDNLSFSAASEEKCYGEDVNTATDVGNTPNDPTPDYNDESEHPQYARPKAFTTKRFNC